MGHISFTVAWANAAGKALPEADPGMLMAIGENDPMLADIQIREPGVGAALVAVVWGGVRGKDL
jgi:hypothetical protein